MRTRAELEQEDDDFVHSADPASCRYSDYLRNTLADSTDHLHRADMSTSDYSTSSSNTNTLDSRTSTSYSRTPNYSSDYSSSQPSPASTRQNSHVLPQRAQLDGSNDSSRQNSQIMRQEGTHSHLRGGGGSGDSADKYGGKFFVMSTIPSPHMPHKRGPNRVQTDSVPQRNAYSPRSGGGYRDKPPSAFDVTKIVGNSTLQRREKERQDRASRREGSGDLRHRLYNHGGSLDSLIDSSLMNRLDSSFGGTGDSATTDSEQGELYQALVTDFDQRMNDMKTGSSENTPPMMRPRSKTIDSPRNKNRPDSVLLTIGGEKHLVPRELVDKFRDPSLHRVTTPEGSDPQIGVAFRFEWGKNPPSDDSHSDSLVNAKNSEYQPDVRGHDSRNVRFDSDEVKRAHCGSTPHSNVYRDAVRTQPGTHESGYHDGSPSPGSSHSPSSPPPPPLPRAPTARTSSGFVPKPRAPSPVALRRRDPAAKKKREHRRHTVAGMDDAEHLKALNMLSSLTSGKTSAETASDEVPSQKTSPSSSAWERLRPATSQPPRDVMTWLQEERLRQARSTSDLLAIDDDEEIPKVDHRYRFSEQTLQRPETGNVANRPNNFDFFKHERKFSPSEQRQRRRMRSRELSKESVSSPVSPTSRFPPTSPVMANFGSNSQMDRGSRGGPFTFESSI